MLSNALKVLAATKPPSRKHPIHNIAAAGRRIRELETQLGLPEGKAIFNVGKANARIRELEGMVAGRATAPAVEAAPTPAAQPTPAAALPAVPAEISEVTLAALAKAVYGTSAASTFEGMRTQFTRSGLEVPGLKPAAANPNYTPQFVGLARAVRAERQARVNAFFAKH